MLIEDLLGLVLTEEERSLQLAVRRVSASITGTVVPSLKP